MKNIKNIIIAFFILSLSNLSNAETYRILNPNNENETFLYEIVFVGTVAKVHKQVVASVPSDSFAMYIIGDGWAYDDLTKVVDLPSNSGKSWFGVDEDFEGGHSVIAGSNGQIEIKCSCQGDGTADCKPKHNGSGCFSCGIVCDGVPDPCFCMKCSQPSAEKLTTILKYPFIINASDIIDFAMHQTTHRCLDFSDSSICYVYTIVEIGINEFTISRTSEAADQNDVYQTLILGDNYVWDSYGDISLPDNGGDNKWYFVDIDNLGSFSVINGGGVIASCSCKTKLTGGEGTPDCDPYLLGNCAECEVNSACLKCNPISFNSANTFYNVPIIINSRDMTFSF